MLPLINKLTQGKLNTYNGIFEVSIFSDGLTDVTALHTFLSNNKTLHLKIQSSCLTAHYFNSIECDCKQEIDKFQEFMSKNDNSILIILNQEGRGNGNVAHIASQNLKKEGLSQEEAYEKLGFPKDNRNYDIVAKTLIYLGFNSCVLHSKNSKKIQDLEKFGIKVESIEGY
jgi:3,4-dihydroxy 2-butanone 4-phosphate synthase/GTP cyclohydrolase II